MASAPGGLGGGTFGTAVGKVARYNGVSSQAAAEAAKQTGQAVDGIFASLPTPVAQGASIGAMLGTPLGPVGMAMTSGVGAVAGAVWSAATGLFD